MPTTSSTSVSAPSGLERPYTRHEVAQLLGKSEKTVDLYMRLGKLQRVYRTDSRRSIGYTRESVHALLKGWVRQ